MDRTAAQKKHAVSPSSHSGDSAFTIPVAVCARPAGVTQKAALLANPWLLFDYQ
jgi:hypothetical protein